MFKYDFFDVEIIRPRIISDNNLADKTGNMSEKSMDATDYDRLGIEEKRILLYLLDHEKISRKEAVELLAIGVTKTKGIFNAMLDKKLIVREGQGRSTYYQLKGISQS